MWAQPLGRRTPRGFRVALIVATVAAFLIVGVSDTSECAAIADRAVPDRGLPAAIAALVVTDMSGRALAEFPLDETLEFRVWFVHSSERHLWVNVFSASGANMVLKEIRVPSTGPGVPSVVEPGWHIAVGDGWIVYSGVDRIYDELVFLLSSISPHMIEVGGESCDLPSILGDGVLVKLRVVVHEE
jgi:hypothetical protein